MTKTIGSVAVTAVLAAFGIALWPAPPASAADECITAPTSPPPQGSHWYYRTDRKTGRKCWNLGPSRGVAKAVPRPLPRPASLPRAATTVEHADDAPAQSVPAVDARKADATSPAFGALGQDVPAETASVASDQAGVERPPSQNVATKAPGGARLADNAAPPADDPLNPLNPVSVAERGGIIPSTSVVPPPSPVGMPVADARTETQGPPDTESPVSPSPRAEPLASPQAETPATPSGTVALSSFGAALAPASRPLLVIAAVLAVIPLILLLTLSASERRRRAMERREADRNEIAAPKLAPSIFDIKEVPPLAPIGPSERPIHTGDLLRKLLRDVERSQQVAR